MVNDSQNHDRTAHASAGFDLSRRQFTQATAALGLAGLVGERAAGTSMNSEPPDDAEILTPDMGDTTYWEMLMFSCLQGLANREESNVFAYYPEKSEESWYDDHDVPEDRRVFYEWYQEYDSLTFDKFDDPYRLFAKLEARDEQDDEEDDADEQDDEEDDADEQDEAEDGDDEDERLEAYPFDGYVVVDRSVPITANIAANYASTERLLPVTADLHEREELPDKEIVYDLRGEFQGVKFGEMSKVEVYEWAFANQWPDATKSQVANLQTPKPAPPKDLPTNGFHTSNRARDYTVAEGGFFFDLTTGDGQFADQRDLKGRILDAMDPRGFVFGWHTDSGSEEKHVGQISNYGQLALGASTHAANFSFHSRFKVPGAVERFRQTVETPRTIDSLQNKVYLTFVLSDGDSLNFLMRRAQGGQWLLDERGEFPIGWEMAPVLTELGPGILDYFQATATDSDDFTVGPSGIGYFYPEQMPTDLLEGVLNETNSYLKRTGLSSITVMSPIAEQVDDETAQVYEDTVGENITGVMEGYARRDADTERLWKIDENSSHDPDPPDYADPSENDGRNGEGRLPVRSEGATAWVPTAYPAGKQSIEALVEDFRTLAERRPQRPVFVPVHVLAHNLTITDLKEVVDHLDADVFEVVGPDVFYTLFAHARQNTVLLRPPEGFSPVEQLVRGGETNDITYEVQNFGDEPVTVDVKLQLTVNSLSDPITSETTVRLEDNETKAVTSTLDVPDVHSGDGRLKYSLDGKTKVSTPIKFFSQTESSYLVPYTNGGTSDEPAFTLVPEGDTYADIDEDSNTNGPDDLSADVFLGYDTANLYLRMEVTDDVHAAIEGATMWRADSAQWAVATTDTYGPEYGLSRVDGRTSLHRWADGTAVADPSAVEASTSREDTTTTYEATIPWDALFAESKKPGDSFLFSVLVNERDGDSRDAVLGWTLPGISDVKAPSALGTLVLESRR